MANRCLPASSRRGLESCRFLRKPWGKSHTTCSRKRSLIRYLRAPQTPALAPAARSGRSSGRSRTCRSPDPASGLSSAQAPSASPVRGPAAQAGAGDGAHPRVTPRAGVDHQPEARSPPLLDTRNHAPLLAPRPLRRNRSAHALPAGSDDAP